MLETDKKGRSNIGETLKSRRMGLYGGLHISSISMLRCKIRNQKMACNFGPQTKST
jgi:hypothetical protein